MARVEGDAWDDLMQAISLLSKHKTTLFSPFHCEHDVLYVCSDYSKYSPEELAKLEGYGFIHNDADNGFMSYRYGSA